MVRLGFLVLVLFLFLVACGDGAVTPVAEVSESPPAQEPAATARATSEEAATDVPGDDPTPTATDEASSEANGQSGVRGIVTAYSDVGSQPDEPLAEQTVVILPLEAASSVLGTATSPAPDELRFLQTTVPEPDERVTLAVSDAAGRYEATLDPGNYVLCLADAAGPTPTDYPLAVRGCGAFMVPAGAVVEVNVSSGFGEIVLEAG
ncbi:MAG: hypothetical protein ACOC9X_05450 [bacterium]